MREPATLRHWLGARTGSERATVARLWSLQAEPGLDPDLLADVMLRPEVVGRLVESLGERERAALERLQEHGGRMLAAPLEREFGAIRSHADYPNPRAYLLALEQPPSPTERLYTLALIQVAQEGARRLYAIPADLLDLLPPVPLRQRAIRLAPTADPTSSSGGEARLTERRLLELLTLAQDGLLELIPSGGLNKASLVRLARRHDPSADLKGVWREEHWPFVRFLRQVAEGAGLLRVDTELRLRPTRAMLEWLQLGATARARRLLDGWAESQWDELLAFDGIKAQRPYSRSLPLAKRATLGLLAQVPPGRWFALADFVAAVKAAEPDFARPDGRFDSWGLVGPARQPLDGFEHWDAVEGRQLVGVAIGSLRWLGLTDLGWQGEEATSFRISALGAALLGSGPPPEEPPPEPLVVQPSFEVLVPAYASPYARFQIGRIADREARAWSADEPVERYTLTKRRVQAALDHGIPLDSMLRFLREQSGRELPQNVAATLREWAGQYGQVSLRRAVLLEAEDAVLLEQIRRDRRVRLPQVEPLTERAWLLREGDAPELAERLRKAGYGLSGEAEAHGPPLREHDLTVLYAALEFYSHACAELGVEGEASAALRRRVARLLPEKQLGRAYRASRAAVQRLRERLAGGA